MKVKPLVYLLFLACAEVTHAQQVKIGIIDYFGTKQIDVAKVKSSMPVHEGDMVTFDNFPNLIIEMKAAVERITGKEPTDVAPGCCDENGNWYIYIGLPGKKYPITSLQRSPARYDSLSRRN
jgi:hypothetical protein